MAEVLLIRLDAPLISFGGACVDNYGYSEEYPALSMVTGLLANALGYCHHDFERLQRLQSRIRMASRCDRPGERIVDYQTVDLGLELMSDDLAWTTRGRVERRAGASSTETHIRYRYYLADAVYTIALCLEPVRETPTLGALAEALQTPARPLFIGRKCCIPSGPLFLGVAKAASPLAALEAMDRLQERGEPGPLSVWWEGGEGAEKASRVIPISDHRDWANQVHTGRSLLSHGTIDPPMGGQS